MNGRIICAFISITGNSASMNRLPFFLSSLQVITPFGFNNSEILNESKRMGPSNENEKENDKK